MTGSTNQRRTRAASFREEEVRFHNGDTLLAGTLLVPASEDPHPAVAMIQGSGPADSDNFGYFPPIREHFANHGIAVLCFDKPGIGGSSGDWTRQSFPADRAREALAAVSFLQSRDWIDPERVGLWGISQGGWVLPLAASMSPEVAFVVTVSGPGVTPMEQNFYDVEHNMRADGLPEEQVRRGIAYVAALMEAALRKESYERVEEAVLREARGEPWYGYFEVDSGVWTFFLRGDPSFDPARVLDRVTCPVLAIFGELDRQAPALRSAEIFREALTRAGNRDFTIRIFPGADHGIGVGQPPSFAPGYIDTMTDWMLERVGRQ